VLCLTVFDHGINTASCDGMLTCYWLNYSWIINDFEKVSVKVQFFCLPIGQKRITCRSRKRHVHCVLCRGGNQPVHNETFIDRSIIKWVQCACVSTMMFQSLFFKLFIKHLRRSIYPVLVSNEVHSNNRWIIHVEAPQQYAASKLLTKQHVNSIKCQSVGMEPCEQSIDDLKRIH
jgi:hypothetical protein